MKTALKTLIATSAILTAGFTQAQSYSVQGLDRESPANAVGGSSYINIDLDSTSPCLAYLSGIVIEVPAGFSAYGVTYGASSGVGPKWEQTWTAGCGSPPSQVDFFSSGFRIIYNWGNCSSQNSAGAFSGIYTGTLGNVFWNCAQLVVVVDGNFAPLTINLITHNVSSAPHDNLVYDLY